MAETQSVQMDTGSTGPTPPAEQQPATNKDAEGNNSRPEWLPEKFDSPEDLAKAYSELESKLGKGNEQAAGEEQAADTQDSEQSNTEGSEEQGEQPSYGEAIDSALNSAGLKPQDVQKEFIENQGLTDETYDKLEKAGYPREVVDAYVRGVQSQAQTMAEKDIAEIKAEAGGDVGFQQLSEWAQNNLSQQELDEYNRAVESGRESAKWAVRGLYAKFQQAEGREPTRELAGKSSAQSGDVFNSTQQVVEAMKDARYQSDPAYRKYVQEKLQRSNVF